MLSFSTPPGREKQGRADIVPQSNQQHDPLTRMPPEIASLIFRLAIQLDRVRADEIQAFLDEIGLCRKGPIWLASVCSAWRQIAISEPRLWSTIDITYHASMPILGLMTWKPPLDLVEEWLKRSGAVPLRIMFNWTSAPQAEDNSLACIIKALCGNCHRWKSLFIKVPTRTLPWFESAKSISAIDLDHLYIGHRYADDHFTGIGQVILRPRRVLLPNFPWRDGAILWTNLVTLEISATPYQVLHIIHHAKRMNDLKVLFVGGQDDGNISPQAYPVQATHLQMLDVGFMGNSDFHEFFVNIRAPKLGTLRLLTVSEDETDVTLGCLESLLSGGKNRLRVLAMGGMTISFQDLHDFLARLDKLQHLTLLYHQASVIPPAINDFFLHFAQTSPCVTDSNDTALFLPQLSHITYMGPRIFSWKTICTVVEAHNVAIDRDSRRPLKYVLIDLAPTVLPHDLIDKELLEVQALQDVRVYFRAALLRPSFVHHGLDYPWLAGAPLPRQLVVRPCELMYR